MAHKNMKTDKTKFCDFIGYSPESKILEYVLETRTVEFTFNDVITGAGINRQRAYGILNKYATKGILQQTAQVKRFKLYRLNIQNKEVQAAIKLFDTIVPIPKKSL